MNRIKQFAALIIVWCAASISFPGPALNDPSAQKLKVLSASVSPQLFSPNGDGLLDEIQISAQLAVRGTDGSTGNGKTDLRLIGSILVQGPAGSRSIPFNQPAPSTKNGNDWAQTSFTLSWDGRMDSGSLALDGDYSFTLQAAKVLVTPSGQQNIKDQIQAPIGQTRVDTTPPQIEILVPEDGYHTTANAVLVAGSACDESSVVSVFINGTLAALNEGVFSVPSFPISLGENEFIAVATDAAGNRGYSTPIHIVRTLPGAVITTVAGDGTSNFDGDGQPATEASLNQPMGIAVGPDGALYIADSFHHRIRRVGQDGIITTVAGNGTAGFSGDNVPAINSRLNEPKDVAIAPDGTMYIADVGNSRIRKVGVNGIIQTFAGNGFQGNTGDGGLATSARLRLPEGVELDASGNVFIADTANHRIRKVGTNGIITRVAGTSSGFTGDGGLALNAQFRNPSDVTVHSSGILLIADTGNHRIRRVALDGTIQTIAGNGFSMFQGDDVPANLTGIHTPGNVAIDSGDNILIADTFNFRIRKIDPLGIIHTVAGNGLLGFSGDGGPATSASINAPRRVIVSNGGYYFSDANNGRIRHVGSLGGGDGAPPDISLQIPDVQCPNAPIIGSVVDAGGIANLTVNGEEVPLTGSAEEKKFIVRRLGNSQGWHISVRDTSGNVSDRFVQSTDDLTPPRLQLDNLSERAPDGRVPIRIAFEDNGSGIDLSTLTIRYNGSDITTNFIFENGIAQSILGVLGEIQGTLEVDVRDRNGNRKSIVKRIRISGTDSQTGSVNFRAGESGTVVRQDPGDLEETAQMDVPEGAIQSSQNLCLRKVPTTGEAQGAEAFDTCLSGSTPVPIKIKHRNQIEFEGELQETP